MKREIRAEMTVRSSVEDGDPAILLQHWYGSATFRVQWITETLRRNESGDRYTVKVKGPRQTGKGNDHGSTSGDRTWEADARQPETPPAEVSALCLGRDALAALLAPAEVSS